MPTLIRAKLIMYKICLIRAKKIKGEKIMRKFLASVGTAKLLGMVGGKLEHVADVRTLTESTLSFSNTQEEIRAGQGAQLIGRFSHDSGMTCNLTVATFDIDFIAKQVGGTIIDNPNAFYTDTKYQLQTSTRELTLTRIPQNIGRSCGLQYPMVWVRPVGCGENVEWKAFKATGNKVTIDDELVGKNLCIEYFVDAPQATGYKISAQFIPAELVLILTTQLFAGDANAKETGRPIGYITVKIPRFSLDGTFDLSMAMSSAATISLQGTALAVDDGTCEGKGVYAEIVEVIEGSSVMDGLADIIVDEETLKVGAVPGVWGNYGNHVSKIPNTYYGSTALNDSGEFASAGSAIIVVYDKETYTITNLAAITEAGRGEADGTLKVTGKAAKVPYIAEDVIVSSN